jgi:hypothetical protein
MVYLVWERESYCDYDVIKVFDTLEKAESFVSQLDETNGNSYRIESKEVE